MNSTCLRFLSISALLLGVVVSLPAQGTQDPTFPYQVKHHELTLKLDLERHQLQAEDQLTLMPTEVSGETLELLLRRGLTINGLWLNGKKVNYIIFPQANPERYETAVDSDDVQYYQRAQVISLDLGKQMGTGQLNLKISYAGIVQDSLGGADFSREYVAMQATGIISDTGIYLGPEGIYYPTLPRQLFTYNLKVTLPEGWKTVSEGELRQSSVQKNLRQETWACTHPIDGFHLTGGKYQVQELDHKGVKLSTYFFPDTTDLAHRYLQACQNYVDLYDSLLGPYPFKKFAVVENFMATGYGMPSFTLLGSEVIRLPFIISTSLGHEICHNWWGNSVFVDYASGNWCEGLTTYCADYLYKERRSPAEAKEYRKNLLQDYNAYTHDNNDFPLKDFVTRHNPAQRAVGYGKSAMVFHMLRQRLGEEIFWKSLQRFYRDNLYKFATWGEVQRVFEGQAGRPLGEFFDQWVNRVGAPSLSAMAPTLTQTSEGWTVHFSLQQKQTQEPYVLDVPIFIAGDNQSKFFSFHFEGREAVVELETDFQPHRVSVDPNFDVFRRLDRGEIPPTLSEVLGAQNLLVVLPTQAAPDLHTAYQSLADQLNREGHFRLVRDVDLKPEDYSSSALFFLGNATENSAIRPEWTQNKSWSTSPALYQLLGKEHADPQAALLAVERNPLNTDFSVAYFSGKTAASISEAGRKLIHYGKYSYLVFYGGKNQIKGTWEVTSSPLTFNF